MEKMICSSCGATLIPNNTQAFLVCEYCDTSVPNPHYDEAAAKAAAEPTLEEICVETLIQMGENENLASLGDCFGNPLKNIDSSRAALNVPDDARVYLLYHNTTLLIFFKEGLALTDRGVYYKCGSDEGYRSWEAFITGPIACVDRSHLDQDSTLTIGNSLTFEVSGDDDARLARFLIDFHNHVYQKHTGQAAPTTWAVTASTVQAQRRGSSGMTGKVIAAGAGLAAARSILRRATPQRTAARSHSILHTTRKVPAARQHAMPAPQRPGVMPRPGGILRPGGMPRPGSRPGGMGRPGGPGGRGGRGGPGRR